MKKRAAALILTVCILFSAAPALAGVWRQDEAHRWFENSDGSRPVNGIYNIGGVEYIFNEEGYLLRDTWTLQADGAWYYCLSDGAVAKDQWIDGKYVGPDGRLTEQVADAVPVLGGAAQQADAAPVVTPQPAPEPTPEPAPTPVLESDEVQGLIRAADAGDINAMIDLGDRYADGWITGASDMASALNWYVRAANAGNAEMMNRVGSMFFYGNGTQVDYDLAAYYYYAAADKGVYDAMYNIGYMFNNGRGVEQNVAAAITWWRKAADAGEPVSIFELGRLYRNGRGVTRSMQQAKQHFYRAAECGFTPAMLIRGTNWNYEDFGDIDTARALAEAGNVSAMYTLAFMCYQGDGTEKNDGFADHYWYMAADAGNVPAMYCVGYAFINGIGTERNVELGRMWIDRFAEADWGASLNGGQQAAAVQQTQQQTQRQAQQQTQQQTADTGWNEEEDWDDAESLINRLGIEELIDRALAGDAQAAYTLGWAFTYGVGVDPDPETAFDWYLRAAEEDYYLAYHVVAELCYGMQNYDEAIRWYKKAAEEGFAEDMNALGNIYFHGMVAAQDYAEALKWYLMAADEGDEVAMHSAADILAYGYGGVPVDDSRAFALYLEAAQMGNVHSMNNVGVMYFSGRGTQQDYGQAVQWFTQAAENGNSQAMYNLGQMYEYGRGVGKSASTARSWYQRAAAAGHQGAKDKLGQ